MDVSTELIVTISTAEASTYPHYKLYITARYFAMTKKFRNFDIYLISPSIHISLR